MKRSSFLAAGLLAVLGACSSSEKGAPGNGRDFGTGLHTIDRNYGKSADKVWDAVIAAVKAYDLRIDSDRHDELGGDVVAHRADGQRVTAKVTALDKNNSRVSVRVEPGNRDLAGMIQERIADKLGMGEAKSAFLGGNTAEGTYRCDRTAAMAAAERSAKALNFTVTNKEWKDSQSRLDARTPDSTPVRFQMDPVDKHPGSTKVTFIAGNGKTEESATLVSQMKATFDRESSVGGR